jgi:alanine racemase
MLKNKGILTIDLNAVVHNYNVLRAQAAQGARVAAVVKANGYGLGSVAIGKVLAKAGCRDFFVSSFEEGLVLRSALKEPRIYVLNGFYGSVAEAYAEHNLIPALGSFLEIEDYRKLAAKLGRKLDAFLSFNIRMNRLGLGKVETEKLIADKTLLEGINISGVLSHFACADEDNPINDEQHEIFEKSRGIFRRLKNLFPIPSVRSEIKNIITIFYVRVWASTVLILRPARRTPCAASSASICRLCVYALFMKVQVWGME